MRLIQNRLYQAYGLKKTTLILHIVFTACPNSCSGHGICSKNNVCRCYPGYCEGDCSQRVCPYGHPYADVHEGEEDSPDLECAGQGVCDRTTGLCTCNPGYEGYACERTTCPNTCSGHGVCTPTMYLEHNLRIEVTDRAFESNLNTKYTKWDKLQRYSCVCDKEYTGYDCSFRKCPLGYIPNSDCDAPSQTIQTITFKVDSSTNGNNIYLEYIDPMHRVWYTSAFDPTKEEEWQKALYTLPTGSINLESVSLDKPATTESSYVATIKFGKYQTGRQEQITILDSSVLSKEPYSDSTKALGYHGLLHEGTVELKDVVYSTQEGVPPFECSNNGICDGTTGICQCYKGFYGISCTEIATLI